jgi:RNA recognition motif-containing protein
MPRASNTNSKDEHLIFVKNVPADLAKAAIPELFSPYEPVRIKNVYPKGNITTVVVGFDTHEKASRAQEDTDGLRLENVVLRVEMYSKHRSVRFLRDARTNQWSLGAEEDEFEDEYEDETPAEPEYTLPFGRARQDRSGPATWAQIVREDRRTGMVPLPPPRIALSMEHSTLLTRVASLTSPIQVAVPRPFLASKTDNTTSTLGSTDGEPAHSPNTSPVDAIDYVRYVEENWKPKKQVATTKPDWPPYTSIFTPWEPINTSQRISQRHCRDCTFCQKRVRNEVSGNEATKSED